MRMISLAASVAALVAISAPAQSATLTPAVFNFTVGSNNNISDGNVRSFSASSPQLGTYNVKVSGWSLEKVGNTTYVRDSKLMVYDKGLGVISGDDDNGSSGQHTIDNSKRKDFIILQFDRQVKLLTAQFSTFNVLNGAKDSDATIMYGITNISYNTSLVSTLNDKTQSTLNALFSGSYSSLVNNNGADNTRNINPNLYAGNIWLIGANFTNADGIIDGFKLTNLAVIPEPASWAMMIAGFGLVGGVARRRQKGSAALA